MSIKCPNCGNEHRFTITASVDVTVNSNRDVLESNNSDITWESVSAISCNECRALGVVGEWDSDNTTPEDGEQLVNDFKVGDRARLKAQYRQGRKAMDIDNDDQPGWTCSLSKFDPLEFIVEKVDDDGDLMTPKEEEWVPWQAYMRVPE